MSQPYMTYLRLIALFLEHSVDVARAEKVYYFLNTLGLIGNLVPEKCTCTNLLTAQILRMLRLIYSGAKLI